MTPSPLLLFEPSVATDNYICLRAALSSGSIRHLTGDEPSPYEELATATGQTAGALRVAVHRLRKEFRATLRDTIAETVLRNEDVDDELRFLLRVIVQESDRPREY